MPSNKTKGRVFELGDHRAVVRKDTKRKSTDLDRKWRMACSCALPPEYFATSLAAETAAEAHITAVNRIVMHEEKQ